MTPATLTLALALAAAPAASQPAFEPLAGTDVRDAVAAIGGQAAALRARVQEAGPLAAKQDPGRYPVRGIDVSHHQDRIDWKEVKSAGISFAYLKATEGTDHVDAEFSRNWSESARAGVLRGAYHFYNLCLDGAEQAELFLRTVPADPGALPPAVDMERSRRCSRLPRVERARRQLAVFLARLRKAYGKRPVLYATLEVYETYLKEWGDPDRLWMTSASGSPAFPEGQRWLFWQHSDRGRVEGVPWRVDLDVFNGTPEQLAALAQPEAGAAVAQARPED